MTDYDYGYWIMRQNGAPVEQIRNTVLTEAKAGRFTIFGEGVRDACRGGITDTKTNRAFLESYRIAQAERPLV